MMQCSYQQAEVEQTNAIVILPRFMRFWTAMLKQLPVFATHELSYYSKLYTVGSRAPEYMQGQGPDKPQNSMIGPNMCKETVIRVTDSYSINSLRN